MLIINMYSCPSILYRSEYLHGHVEEVLDRTMRSKRFKGNSNEGKGTILDNLRTSTLKEFNKRTKVPKGSLPKAFAIIKGETDDPNFSEKRLEKVLQRPPTGLTLWKDVVQQSFENSWSEGILKVQQGIAVPKSAKGKEKAVESTENPLDEESPTKAKEHIRTATVTLRNAMRPDLLEDGDPTYQTLVRLADDAQLAITNMIDELSCLTLKSTLIVS